MSVGKINPRQFRFGLDVVYSGVLQNVGHTLTQVRIQADAAGGGTQADHYFNGWAFIVMKTGPAAGQGRRIVSFLTATDDVIVERPFTAIPGADQYAIYLVLGHEPFIGQATAGSEQTLDLPIKEAIRTGFYRGLPIYLIGGAQGGGPNSPWSVGRDIIEYDGPNRRARFNRPLPGAADNTTVYLIPGHLYSPLADLQIDEDGGAAMLFGEQIGDIAFGNSRQAAGFGPSGGQRIFPAYREIAGVGAGGTLIVTRWDLSC